MDEILENLRVILAELDRRKAAGLPLVPAENIPPRHRGRPRKNADPIGGGTEEILKDIVKNGKFLVENGKVLDELHGRNTERPRKRLTVIHGGAYVPPTITPQDDHLTDEFRAFLRRERGGKDPHVDT